MAYRVSDSYQSPDWGKPLTKRNDNVVDGEMLKEALARVEHLDNIAASIREDKADLMKELKARGMNLKAFRRFLGDRKRRLAEDGEALAARVQLENLAAELEL